VRRPNSASRLTRTCCGTPAASRWPTKGTIRGLCRRIWGTRTSSTPSDILSYRRRGSRISGEAKLVRYAPDSGAKADIAGLLRCANSGSDSLTVADRHSLRSGPRGRVNCSGLFLEGPVHISCVCISACKRCFSSSGPEPAPRQPFLYHQLTGMPLLS
jgi:hypothetical protein